MSGALAPAVVARVALAIVFGVAGVSKLSARDRAAAGMRDFGVRDPLAAPAAAALVALELATAAALIVPASAWWGALLAEALLAMFVAAIALSLLRGRTPDCRCFGQLHSAPVGPKTLVRNLILAAVAAAALLPGPGAAQLSPFGWMDHLDSPELVLTCVVAAMAVVIAGQGWFLFELLRQNGRILRRMDSLERYGTSEAALARPASADLEVGLPVGAPAPRFRLPSAVGPAVSLEDLLGRGLPVLLVFTDSHCGPCSALLPRLAEWQREHHDRLTIALVSRGAGATAEHGIRDVLLQDEADVAAEYEVTGTPTGVLISVEGRIDSALAPGAPAIEDLLERATAGPLAVLRVGGQADPLEPALSDQAAALTVGDEVPELEWSDLDGKPVALSDFAGSALTLVFWNPRCAFCNDLLPELHEWESSNPAARRRLLLISTGAPEENRGLGLSAPIVLEPDFATGRLFDAPGTPSAVQVSEDGRVATPVAVGGPDVLSSLPRQEEAVAAG